jgi:2-(1,2-epoxy-1,2-dihydrophenyl)acetyl-CoA isomerase
METIDVERGEGIVTVTLNRPEKKNAANAVMWNELLEVFEEVADRVDDRVMVVTGAGDAFCSGADLTDAARDERPHQLIAMRHIADVALALHRIAKPTIAKVNGVAAGAGCNLALGCDLIVASDTARFSEIFAKRGLSLDFGGSWILPRLVGLHKAKELAFFAEVISAAEAERIGIVNKVVPGDEFDAAVEDWARKLAAKSPLLMRMGKDAMYNSMDLPFEDALELLRAQLAIAFATEDIQEGVRAFFDKREPKWTGR